MPAEWERLDAPAVVPRRQVGTGGAAPAGASQRPVRLRRSRSQVLAALDAGGSMLQGRGRDLLVGSAILLLPVVALNLWATSQVFDRTGATTLTALGGDDVGTGVEDVAAMLAVVFASMAAAIVGCFASIILLGERFGARVALRPALATTMRRLPVVVVAWAIGHLWVPFLTTWALASPSDSLSTRLVLVLPLATFCSMATLYVVPVIVGEGAGPVASLVRSWRLVQMRAGSALGFVLSATLVGSLLLAGISFLPALAEAAGFITFGDLLWLVQGVSSQLAVIVVVSLVALATAQLYVLVRLDAEGLDIILDADAAFGAR